MKPGDMFNKHKAKKEKKRKLFSQSQPKAGMTYLRGRQVPSYKGQPVNSMIKSVLKKKKKNWIAGAIKKPGALHKELGIKAGKKIPAKTLAKAAKKGGKEGKRARLAETLKSFHHKKKGMKCKKHKKMKCKMCK